MLRAMPGVRERVDYDALAWVEQQDGPPLAPVRAEERLGRVSALDYAFPGGTSVREWVRAPLGSEQLRCALVSLAETLRRCVDARERLSLVLEPQHVFADASGCLTFCCLPMQGRSLRRHTSLSSLLGALAGPEVHVLGGTGALVLERLRSLMDEYRGEVDLRLLVFFLANTAGYQLPPELLSVLEEEDGTGTSATIGEWPGEEEPQTGVSASWRGVHDRGFIDNYRRDRDARSGARASSGRREPVSAEVPPPAVPPSAVPPVENGQGPDGRVAAETPASLPEEPRTQLRRVPTTSGSFDGIGMPADEGGYALVRVATGERFRIGPGETVRLGRGSACTVRVHQNPRVSRLHATLRIREGRVRVTDEGSSNGTWVAGGRVPPHETREVRVGERFSLANEEFYVQRS